MIEFKIGDRVIPWQAVNTISGVLLSRVPGRGWCVLLDDGLCWIVSEIALQLVARAVGMPPRRDVPPHRYDWPESTANMGPVYFAGKAVYAGPDAYISSEISKPVSRAWGEWGANPVFPGQP